MARFLRSLKIRQVLGVGVAILGCLVVAVWGDGSRGGRPGRGDWELRAEPAAPVAMPLLRLAAAEAAGLGQSELGGPAPQGPGGPRGWEPVPGPSRSAGDPPAQVIRVTEAPGFSEDGKDGRPASGIPFPAALPSPRIEIFVAPDGGGPVPDGWSLKEFAGKAKLKVEKVGPFFALHLNSERASFGVHKNITVDVSQYPYLSWAWRVDQLPPKGDVRQKETDDQAAQLYVVFPRFPAMLRSQILGYVWDSTAPAGTALNSPSNRLAKVLVLRSGTERLGQWVLESRNVLEDFRRLFGDPPPKVGKLSLLINSQNTKSSAESWFAGLVFTRNPLRRDIGTPADAPPSWAERESGPGRL